MWYQEKYISTCKISTRVSHNVTEHHQDVRWHYSVESNNNMSLERTFWTTNDGGVPASAREQAAGVAAAAVSGGWQKPRSCLTARICQTTAMAMRQQWW